MLERIKQFFETDLYYTTFAYEHGVADKNAYWYGLQRCYGVAQFFIDEVEGVAELYEEYKKKYEELGKEKRNVD